MSKLEWFALVFLFVFVMIMFVYFFATDIYGTSECRKYGYKLDKVVLFEIYCREDVSIPLEEIKQWTKTEKQ